MNRARIADDNRVRGHIAIDESPRRNQNIISDSNLANDRSVHANTYTAADGGYTLARATTLLSDSHSFMEMTIIAQNRTAIHRDVVGMSQVQTFPYPSTTRYFYSMPS